MEFCVHLFSLGILFDKRLFSFNGTRARIAHCVIFTEQTRSGKCDDMGKGQSSFLSSNDLRFDKF